eukprot:4859292-Lingulodinium_polyedra.AAC.1
MAEAYWATKEHIDVLHMGEPSEEELRSYGYRCHRANKSDIPAIIPDGQGPFYLYYVLTGGKNHWP